MDTEPFTGIISIKQKSPLFSECITKYFFFFVSDPAETSTSPAPWANWELPEPPRIQPLGTDEDLPIVIDKEYCPEPVERARNDDMNGLNMERPSEGMSLGQTKLIICIPGTDFFTFHSHIKNVYCI